MVQDVVSSTDAFCSGKCVRCRIILPLYYFLVSVVRASPLGRSELFPVTQGCLGSCDAWLGLPASWNLGRVPRQGWGGGPGSLGHRVNVRSNRKGGRRALGEGGAQGL